MHLIRLLIESTLQWQPARSTHNEYFPLLLLFCGPKCRMEPNIVTLCRWELFTSLFGWMPFNSTLLPLGERQTSFMWLLWQPLMWLWLMTDSFCTRWSIVHCVPSVPAFKISVCTVPPASGFRAFAHAVSSAWNTLLLFFLANLHQSFKIQLKCHFLREPFPDLPSKVSPLCYMLLQNSILPCNSYHSSNYSYNYLI